ncbi:hypothetical protein P4O66_014698, partial [Electrophorus voltai]
MYANEPNRKQIAPAALPSIIKSLECAMGKIMEQGPVLIITFQARVVMVIRSAKGEGVDGDL